MIPLDVIFLPTIACCTGW